MSATITGLATGKGLQAPPPIPLPGVFEAGNPQATTPPQAQAQAAPQQALPTYTPVATFTPFPTYTPLPTPTQTPSEGFLL